MRYRSRPLRLTISILLFASIPAMPQEPPSLRLEGRTSGEESSVYSFSTFAFNPAGGEIHYSWDFGDDSPRISGEKLASVSHCYRTDGHYTVRVTGTGDGGFALTESLDIHVKNRRPRIFELTKRANASRANTWDFQARARDGSTDDLTYTWDFGDGSEPVSGVDLTAVSHTYEDEGVYAVTLKVGDGDGGEAEKSVEITAGRSRWRATVSGTLGGLLSGEVKPFASLWINPVDGVCRMTITLWDDATQVHMIMIVEPKSFARGFRYRPNANASIYLVADPSPDHHALQKQRLSAPMSLPRIDIGSLEADDPKKAGLERNVLEGLGVNPFRETPEGPAASGQHPLAAGAEEQIRFQVSSGEMNFEVQPYDWIESTFQLQMRNLDDESPYQSISVDGKLFINLADAQTEGMMRARACDEREAFEVSYASPEPESLFLRRDITHIGVSFNRAYLHSTVNDATVRVSRNEDDGNLVPVAGTILHRNGDPDTFEFHFDEPLEEGYYYTVQIKGGDQGVHSLLGEPLAEDAEWRFLAIPDFATTDPFAPSTASSRSSSAGAKPPNVECHVYQSVRDAPLVVGKPAVIRVSASWDDHGAELIPATVIVKDAHGNEMFRRRHDFIHPEHFEEYGIDTARAEHTANFYGWEPDPSFGSPLEATIQIPVQLQPGGGKSRGPGWEFYVGKCSVDYWTEQPRLTYDYYFLELGPWALGVPENEVAIGHGIARQAANYTLQTFPVASVHARSMGPFSFAFLERAETGAYGPALWVFGAISGGLDAANDLRKKGLSVARTELMKMFHDRVAPWTDADVIVGLVPAKVRTGGGTYYDGYPFTKGSMSFAKRAVLLGVRDDIPRKTALAHEFGHAFGIEHLPAVASEAARKAECDSDRMRFPGIDGYRLRRDGTWGFNKSYEEGNAESPRLLPLMYPCALFSADAFIARDQYMKLLDTMKAARNEGSLGSADRTVPRGNDSRFRLAAGPSARGPFVLASTRSEPAPRENEASLLISGLLSEEGVALAPILRNPAGYLDPPDEGPWSLDLVDGTDRIIRTVAFGPDEGPLVHQPGDDDEGGWQYFGFTIPDVRGLERIAVRRGSRTLVARDRSPNRPAIRITSPASGATLRGTVNLTWEAIDPDGDPLTFSVAYSGDGGTSWSPLLIEGTTSSMEVDTNRLTPGVAPMLRVTADDGFDESSTTVPIRLANDLAITSTWPEAGEEVDARPRIEATFNAPLATITMKLLDASGREVEAASGVDGDGSTAWLSPAGALSPGARYEVRIGAGATDRFGNRLRNGFSWSFGVEPDRVPPRIRDVSPRDGALSVSMGAPIRIVFSEAMAENSFTDNWLQLTGPTGTLPGTTRYDPETWMAIFEPARPLERSASYRVTISSIPTDPSGNPLATPRSWGFRTISAAWGEN